MFVKVNWSPDRRQMRNFGWTLLVGLGLVGLILVWTASPEGAPSWTPFQICAGIGLAVWCCAFFLGKSLGLWLYKAWMGLGFAMGTVMGPVMAALLYFGVVTPVALIMRLLGKDAMQRRKGTAATFWKPLVHRIDPESYRRQF